MPDDTTRAGDARMLEILRTVHRRCADQPCQICACLREIDRLSAATMPPNTPRNGDARMLAARICAVVNGLGKFASLQTWPERQAVVRDLIDAALSEKDAELARLRAMQPAPDAAGELLEDQLLYQEAQRLGRSAERAAIVAWLRHEAAQYEGRGDGRYWVAFDAIREKADAIGRGEHARRGDEGDA